MELVLHRDVATGGAPRGFEIATMFKPDGKRMATVPTLVYKFPKAKRADEHPQFGHKSEYGGVTYAVVKHCPFCGAKTGGDDAH